MKNTQNKFEIKILCQLQEFLQENNFMNDAYDKDIRQLSINPIKKDELLIIIQKYFNK